MATIEKRFEEISMRERTIEKKLVQAVKEAGGIALKLACPGMVGMPDRIVLLPMGQVAFVEVKRGGGKPRALQEARHRMLCRLGFQVYVLDDPALIRGMIDAIQTTQLSELRDRVHKGKPHIGYSARHGARQERHHADGTRRPAVC
jgi:hypothetical protein